MRGPAPRTGLRRVAAEPPSQALLAGFLKPPASLCCLCLSGAAQLLDLGAMGDTKAGDETPGRPMEGSPTVEPRAVRRSMSIRSIGSSLGSSLRSIGSPRVVTTSTTEVTLEELQRVFPKCSAESIKQFFLNEF